MLWKECMPAKFYKHICKEKNFLYINCKNEFQPNVLWIIADFLNEDENNYKESRNNLSSFKNKLLIFSTYIPTFFLKSIERTWFRFEKQFSHYLQNIQIQKKLENFLGKNPENFETIRNETNIYEQKLVNVDDFNGAEEKEVRERVEKRKQKRREVAEKNKLLKRKKRTRRK